MATYEIDLTEAQAAPDRDATASGGGDFPNPDCLEAGAYQVQVTKAEIRQTKRKLNGEATKGEYLLVEYVVIAGANAGYTLRRFEGMLTLQSDTEQAESIGKRRGLAALLEALNMPVGNFDPEALVAKQLTLKLSKQAKGIGEFGVDTNGNRNSIVDYLPSTRGPSCGSAPAQAAPAAQAEFNGAFLGDELPRPVGTRCLLAIRGGEPWLRGEFRQTAS